MADQPSPRRFQFRLRTLLIGVTLTAVACWVVVDRQRLIRERLDALERLDTVNENWSRERLSSELLTLKLERERARSSDRTPDALAAQALLDKAYGRIEELERLLYEQKALSQSRP
jgi:hypothetical protein